MKISINDYENNRIIIANVPQYLISASINDDDIAPAILAALNLSEGSCEYMIGEFDVVLADHNADTSRPTERGIELLTDSFKAKALQALTESRYI